MENKTFRKYSLFTFLGVLLASSYPIYMGVSVVVDMIRYGTVYSEDYPKYIIPYTPIVLALLIGVALIPFAVKRFKKHALLFGSVISTVVFFASELVLERMVTVTRSVSGIFSTLANWQMYMCYTPPSSFIDRTWHEVDVLLGEYSPTFKFHFYLISVVIITSVLNCFYGFAKMIWTGDTARRKTLVIQAVASSAFIGMCIWACFSSFYRTGTIKVSTISAILMSVFFVLFGITVGIYIASFVLDKRPLLAVGIPGISASLITFMMYVGEMFLLSGHLYRLGEGFLFDPIPQISLAPIDIIVIIISGVITAIITRLIQSKKVSVEVQA